MNIFEEFRWRGMIFDATEGLEATLEQEKVTSYIGFDPSAPSLHVGSLLPIMALARLQRYGHRPVAIVGGGTGLIGDPSGKTDERKLLTNEAVERNLQKIKIQLSHFLDFEAKDNPAVIINNADWLINIPMMTFLRDVGKHFTINYMLSKESVRRRLKQAQGISYTEFSYMLLQAYDYLKLNEDLNCTLQMGGSDQWGNILAGIELIRRLRNSKAHGLVFPLLANSSGTKFGKTESGTVWLNADPSIEGFHTSPFDFYQFWLNTEDKFVIPYLKYFTFLTKEEIEEQEALLETAPEKREPHRKLAHEVTKILHGKTAVEKAERASSVGYSPEITQMKATEIKENYSNAPSTKLSRARFEGDGISLVDLVNAAGLSTATIKGKKEKSKAEARRLIQAGGIYLNNIRVTDTQRRVSLDDAIDGQVMMLRKGSREVHLIELTGDPQ